MAKHQTKVVSKAPPDSAGSSAVRPAAAQEPDATSIAMLAYRLWEQRGCPQGSPEIDWFLAEEELCQPVKAKSSSTKRLLLTRQVGA
jgi:hypothetical protein